MTACKATQRRPMCGSRLVGWALWAVLVTAIVGCSSEPERRPHRAPGDDRAQKSTEAPPSQQPITRNYDPQGKLLPSDDYIVGIRLPRGTELSHEAGLQHVYRIQAPIRKVLAYFGPMMITGNVERRGKGAIYKRASVRGAEVNPTKVDVSILEVGNSLTRIAVTELPPPPAHAPSSDQTKAAAQQSFRTLD
jgi:hypothetical protein